MNVSGNYVISRVKSEKVVTYVTPQGKGVRVTREVYLRKNIPCRTQLCPNNECHLGNCLVDFTDIFKGFSLPSDLRNVVIVDGFYALNYWEIFESTEIQGIVVTLSSLCFVSTWYSKLNTLTLCKLTNYINFLGPATSTIKSCI